MKNTILLLLLLTGISFHSYPQTPAFQVREVITGLDTPWEILWGPDDHIWFTERYGRVSRVEPITGQHQVILDISGIVVENGESGLLGMAVHPGFPDTAEVFLAYTYLDGSLKYRLEKYRYQNGSLIDPQVLLDDIPAASTHDGSRIVITPDRKLLVTTGDAQNQPAAQNNNSLNGKVLRLNMDGSIPSDNPFPGTYIFSKGHRNAQGLVWADNGIIYSSEHGPQNDDEINIIVPGGNYGWPNVHGYCDLSSELVFCSDSNVVEPIYAWTPTLAVCGMDHYDHPQFPTWQNSLLVTTLKADRLLQMKLNAAGDSIVEVNEFFPNHYGRLRDICISPDGKIYIATSNRDGRADGGFPIPSDDRILEIFNPAYVQDPGIKVGVKLSPVPARDLINLEISGNPGNYTIDIFDIFGRRLQQQEIFSGNSLEIDMKKHPAGIYFLRAKDENAGEHVVKFVKQ